MWNLISPFTTIIASIEPWQAGCHLRTATIASRSEDQGSVASPGLARYHLGTLIARDRNPIVLRQPVPVWSVATAPLTAVPVEASGTFNPLRGVLCILRSLYVCTIGPRSVCFLVMDTPHTSNCSPKPLYSRMQLTAPQQVTALIQRTRQFLSIVALSRALPGATTHHSTASHSIAHSICLNPR